MPTKRAPQARNNRDTPEGPERRCSRCTEWWPADAEFFHRTNAGQHLATWCRACTAESKKARAVAAAGQPTAST